VSEEELVLALTLVFGAVGYPPVASRTDEARVQTKAIRKGCRLKAPRTSIHKNASTPGQRGGESGNRAANKREEKQASDRPITSEDKKMVMALTKRYLSHFDAVTLKYRRKKQEGLDGRKRQETATTASNGTAGTLG
jgi:hypothetical protein